MNPLSVPRPVNGNFDRQLGLMLVDWQADRAVITVELTPQHLNYGEIVHGGVLATLIGVTGAYAGCYDPPDFTRRALTLSLSVSYTGQAHTGVLTATAHKRGGGKNLFFSSTEIHDGNGQRVAFGQGTYRYRHRSPEIVDDSDPSDLAPPDIGC